MTLCHLRAYPVAHIHSDVFKTKLFLLCKIDILESCGASQWASSTFIITKKMVVFDGSLILENSIKYYNVVFIRYHKYKIF